MKGLILSLGAPNDAAGQLSTIAKNRLDTVWQVFRFNPSFQVCCTGGIGKHFNETQQAHYIYSQQYLQQRGIPAAAFAPAVYSTNTMEDFKNAKDLIFKLAPELLIVVTSDFHMKRAGIIQKRWVNYPATLYWPATSTVTPEEMAKLEAHELQAINSLTATL
ncbi:YdcF family protein [Chitinophaga vietnamensis]|uniref:YdcF family protein n=1 Tax=Chitinophaga vietnamensis TaxID=2593957 RepID=UPI0011781276|nr:YdcF family protein [Chitinophaga vietnamensis]